MSKETFIVARASGDQQYLSWLRDRLVYVYKESANVDFVQTCNMYHRYFVRRAAVPRWLNWLLRKYDL